MRLLFTRFEFEEANMMSKFTTKLTAIALSVALSVDQALAMGWFPGDGGNGSGSPSGAPELDGPGGLAVIGVIVSVALVLFNRSKNR
jgi:hypothetical protein